jgi:hypothetical protein
MSRKEVSVAPQDEGLGTLGSDQLEWLEKDVKGLPGSTPIVVFALHAHSSSEKRGVEMWEH